MQDASSSYQDNVIQSGSLDKLETVLNNSASAHDPGIPLVI